VQETVSTAFGVTTNAYVWGKDLSGTMQGAGGVGGLLAVSLNGSWYFPFFDANGNITAYVDEQGSVVAEYAYDAFGATISESGTMSDAFAHRFSTKYYDSETGLYYYGYRFYSPDLHRWLNRDPIEEDGGLNLYGFCGNGGVNRLDMLGLFNQQSPYSVSVDVVWQERIRSEKGSYKFDRTYSGKSAFDVVVNPMECSADVNIKIKPSGAFSDETERNAQRWVDQVWNGRFKLCVKSLKEACPNGLALNIKISFVNEGQHHDVRFWNPFPPFQPNQTEWPTSYRADFLIPHEVGHMIGNHDEVLKVTVTDRYRGRVEEFDYGTGAHNIMGIGSNNEAYAYHYDFVARNVEQDAYVAPLVKSRKTGIFLNGREWLPASERKCQECKW
jgi:RHS repeat-associated protein